MRKIVEAGIVALLLVLCGCGKPASAPHTETMALQKEWNPLMDQPIRQLEEILDKEIQQQPINYTSANLSLLYDAKLYIVFNKYVQSLPAGEREQACKLQRDWLQNRLKMTKAAYAEYDGGSLASFSAGSSDIDETKKRISELEAIRK